MKRAFLVGGERMYSVSGVRWCSSLENSQIPLIIQVKSRWVKESDKNKTITQQAV